MKYKVVVAFPVYVTVETEADSKEQAIESALEEAYISNYAGNGGTDKLVGVYGSDLSIEAGECDLSDTEGFEPVVYNMETMEEV